jgi:hypothetical protein
MKKILPILTASLMVSAGLAFGQTGTAMLSFDDTVNNTIVGNLHDSNLSTSAGTFSSGTGTFTIDANLTWSGGTASGLSYWLETESGIASKISITNETYFTFTTPQDTEAAASASNSWKFTASGGTDSGFTRDISNPGAQTGDLGATGTATSATSGTTHVSELTFQITGLAPGTYHLETTHLGTLPSEATVNNNDALFSSQGIYTFTVVPEPATMSLLALGGLSSFGLTALRRRRRN